MALDILIIDDEKDIRDLVSGVLSDDGYETRSAGTAEEALAAFDERLPSLVLLDVWLRGSSMDGLVFRTWKHRHCGCGDFIRSRGFSRKAVRS